MALALLVAALLVGWPRSRRLRLAWTVGTVATLTAVVGSAVWIAAGTSTAHIDPSTWASHTSRIIIAAGVGVFDCGNLRLPPRPAHPRSGAAQLAGPAPAGRASRIQIGRVAGRR
jgi:hypothetical protein